MTTPAPYPRIPHLVAGRGTPDDEVLAPGDRALLLAGDLEAEEKLDGANVMVWLEGERPRAAGRSGLGGADRAGQFGALRAWVATNADQLCPLLAAGEVLYGEWLYLTHTLHYDGLPSWFVALDLRLADGTFLHGPIRRERLAQAGLVLPPRYGEGRFTLEGLDALSNRSAWSTGAAEGVIVRPAVPPSARVRVAKLVRRSFRHLTDAEWSGGRPRNGLLVH